jgi:nucleotide-binding universal stress UspA family protein
MEEHPTGSDLSITDSAEPDERRRILYPVVDGRSTGVLHFAASVAKATDAVLVIGHVEMDPDDVSSDASREAASTLLKARTDSFVDVPIESHAIVGPSPADAIVTAADDYDADLVVFGQDAPENLEPAVAKRVDCDTVVVNERDTLDEIRSVLVPIAGGPHTNAVLAVAGDVASAHGANVELLHVVDEKPSAETTDAAEELLSKGASNLPSSLSVTSTVVDAPDVADPIRDASAEHDCTIVGAPTKSPLQRFVLHSHAEQIMDAARNTLAMVLRN